MRLPIFLFIILSAVASFSCNETLPSYTPPSDFLKGTIRNIGLADVQYSHADVNNVDQANVTIYSPAQILFIDVINTFDETIQDEAAIEGTMELTCDAVPNAKATLTLSLNNLASTQYNSSSKLLTLNPGDTLKLRATWRYKTDDGKWGFLKADVDHEQNFSTFMTRLHKPMVYRVNAKLKLFRSLGYFTAKETGFTVIYSGRIVFPP